MPKTGTNTLTLDGTITTFKVYDDGGKASTVYLPFPETMIVVLRDANGETTNIGTFSLDYETGEWYSLDGRKLSGKPTAKGLYINNGKKVVIK